MPLISKPELPSPEERALTAYVRAVAAELGVTGDDTGSEISELASGFVLLSERTPDRPLRELILTWDDRHGWELVTEEDREFFAGFRGNLLPQPHEVARFVADALRGHDAQPEPRVPIDDPLSALLDRYGE
ncbi:DUF6292 family protein [Amycolatopsis sp. NPDC051371]|uniref:DUF6292 family protein n=1 Tax=Amycolatopsis sp. NPDC051371 TaxID=3155800 RepID=UPI00342B0BBD